MTTPLKVSADAGMGSDSSYDRALGAFIGLAVGDALGTTIEFRARDSYPHVTDMVGGGPFRLKPGEWTDDTSMALCLAESLMSKGGALDPRDLGDRFVRWWRKGENSVTGRCFDIGNATSAALTNFVRTGEPIGSRDPSSAGNGGIMRLAPAAIVGHKDTQRAVALARAQSAVTHAAEECLDAAEVLARVLAAAINGESVESLSAAERAEFASSSVRAIAKGAWRGKARVQIRSSGYVIDTLEAALWAVGSSENFSEAVLKAVNLGDDADTVGAVTGQIAGAIWGYTNIPDAWLARLAWKDRLLETATALWKLSASS